VVTGFSRHVDPVDAITPLIAGIGATGARSFELQWTLPGVPEHEQPDDVPAGVPVVWTAIATWRRPRRRLTGSSEPTANHALGGVEAVSRLVEQLGATVLRTDTGLRIVGSLKAPS
jgi:hypothetical protein